MTQPPSLDREAPESERRESEGRESDETLPIARSRPADAPDPTAVLREPRPRTPRSWTPRTWTPPAPGTTGHTTGVLAGALVLGLVAGVAGAAAYERLSDTRRLSVDQIAGLDPAAATSVASVVAAVQPSVVHVTAARSDGSGETGSGVILTADGEILTSDHVVDAADSDDDVTLTVTFADGRHAEADLLGRDPVSDLALVRVDDAADLTPIPLADPADTRIGEAVVAVGSGYGADATVTAGIIGALHRPVGLSSDGGSSGSSAYGAIQTSAPVSPGDSGGALVDRAGRLVGLSTTVESVGDDAEQDVSTVGFAIAVPQAMPIVEEIRRGETPAHARLGVVSQTADLTDGVTGGAEIEGLSDDSAAERGGLQPGDVLTRLGDLRVGGSASLQAAVYAFRPGDVVTVAFTRDGDERTAEVTLGSDAD